MNNVASVFDRLRAVDPKWDVEAGYPSGSGWILGDDFRVAHKGGFHDLLSMIGETLGTSDRRTIAACFALRYGWSSGSAIAAYVLHGCVPEISLDNVSLKFSGRHSMFDRLALHRLDGTIAPLHDIQLLELLRRGLVEQAEPIVEALRVWSHFPPKATWGLIVSSWGAQCSSIFSKVGNQTGGAHFAATLFHGDDVISQTQPYFYPVSYRKMTRMYYRSTSCCRYYLLPNKGYCATCPLVPQDVRVERNLQWMKQSLGLV